MSGYDSAFLSNAQKPSRPERAVFPRRQIGYVSSPLGSGGQVYVQPSFQSIIGTADWILPDNPVLYASIYCLQPFGGASLYIYLSVDGATFVQTHIFYCPGNTNITVISGLELAGMAARFRLHSGATSNTVNGWICVRSL